MPKRQRVPRYAVVAAEDKVPENPRGHQNNNSGKENSDNASFRQRAMPDVPSPGATTPSPNTSRKRKKNRGHQRQSVRSPSSRQKQSQQPKRQQQNAAEEHLLQLLKACEKHKATYHSDYHPTNANPDSDNIPPACESAITSLRILIPRIEAAIASATNSEEKINPEDILQLCRFYDNVISGTYCPHLPHLFGFGTDPRIMLEKIINLLKLSLRADLNYNKGRTSDEKNVGVNNKNGSLNHTTSATIASEHLCAISQTISVLLAFIIDDCSDFIRHKLFVDWIDFSEDLAVISMMKRQNFARPRNTNCLPVRLILFEESSLVIHHRFQQKEQRNSEEQSSEASNNYESYSLNICQWEEVQILQEIAFNVLRNLTSNESAMERLEISPEQQGEESSLLLGGDMDLFFPSGVVADIDLTSSLVASFKSVMLKPSGGNDFNSISHVGVINRHISVTIVDILLRLCLDWHRLGTATTVLPLLPCIVDAAILTSRTVFHMLSEQQQQQQRQYYAYEERLAFLLDRIVCHPPGDTASKSDHEHSIARTVHSAVWTVLLDCLEGIAYRLRQRRQRNIQDYQERASKSNDKYSQSSTSAPCILLDLAVVDTINFIAETSPSLALDGSHYCTARRIFPHLFLLSSTTSLPTHQNSRDWNDDNRLLSAANQSLAVFIHALSSSDATYENLLEDACLAVLECRTRSSNAGQEAGQTSVSDQVAPETGNDCYEINNGKDNDGGDLQDSRRNFKRKHETTMLEQQSTSVSTKRRKLFLTEESDVAVFSVVWHDALHSFFELVFEAGESLRDSFPKAITQARMLDNFVTGRIIEQIRCLSGGLRFALSLIRKQSNTVNDKNEDKFSSGISQVAHKLSVQVLSACNLFINTIISTENLETALGYALADEILNCGFSMLFSDLKGWKGLNGSIIEHRSHFLDSVSSFCGRLLELGLRQQRGPLHLEKYMGIPTYFMGVSCEDNFRPQSNLHFTKQLYMCHEHSNEYLYHQSVKTLDSFSLFVRAALFSSMNPLYLSIFTSQSNRKSNCTFEFYSLDLFATFFDRYVESVKMESVQLNSSRNIAVLLHLLPLMFVSLRGRQRENGSMTKVLNKNQKHSGASNDQDLTNSQVNFLRKVLVPLIQTLKNEDTELFQSLVFAIGLIHSSFTDTALALSTRNPTSVFDFIVMKHQRLYPTEKKKDPKSLILQKMMIDIAKAGARQKENPTSRYFLWMCIAKYCMSVSPSEIRQYSQRNKTNASVKASEEILLPQDDVLSWLVAAPFSDPNSLLRKFLSRELSTVLMSNEYGFLLSRYASNEDFKEYYAYSRTKREDRSNDTMNSLVRMSDDVVNGLFQDIDGLLSEDSDHFETQKLLSLGKETMGREEPFDRYQNNNLLSKLHAGATTLASLSYNSGLDHPIAKTLFEKCTLRLIRLWAAGSSKSGDTRSFPKLKSTPVARASAFGIFTCLSGRRNLTLCLSGEISWTHFPSAMYGEVHAFNKDYTRAEQYELLERMICSFFTISEDSLHCRKSLREARNVVTESIPSTIAQLVNERDEETIKSVVGMNIFLTEKNENYKVVPQAGGMNVIGVPTSPMETKKSLALSMSVHRLQKEIKQICLEKIDKMLPLVLFYCDQEEAQSLKFFTKLTAPATLDDMMSSREQLILKGIAWELGRDPFRVGPASRALRIAAVACEKDDLESSQSTPELMPGTNAAKSWVTKNFMYLIVNMVQLNWGSRTVAQQAQALRCLFVLLDFLKSSEAPQYFPQVLSTVNAAIIVNREIDDNGSGGCSLRLHALQCLSKFIRLSAKDNIESVIDNLTTIVVSLLPILEEDEFNDKGPMYPEAQTEAVSVLEFLTRAEFVRKFPKAFSQIPFLPTAGSLEMVHKSLRDNGINFDNLFILSVNTSHSQAGTNSRRGSLTSDNISNSSNSAASSSGDIVSALQNRVSLISSLLDDENASVRKVALQHLVDLLRANRNLFHVLVESEGGSLIKNYLTLVYERAQTDSDNKNPTHSKGVTSVTVSNIIEKLMRRCVHESDQEVRLKLATCLGEMGAISENRLDDTSLFRSEGSGSVSMYDWRLDQPPWQSRAAKYELQLVTKYLVVALKAAPSQEEQLKIAFTIQQLLLLLDDSARETSTLEQDKRSNSQKREMSKWLSDRLVEANVYESVEPFWLSEFSTKDERYSTRQPPFFNASKSYHLWISEFCRWMILKTKDCPLSRWKDFFFACRIVVRSLAGLETAEFVLPLLVLDRICFGSTEEFESICKEFLRILDFDSNSALMDDSERQKAVGGFFAMKDTLEYWAEIEAEQRYRSKNSSNSKRSSRGSTRKNPGGSKNENSLSNWPADDTISQIEELMSRIPLIDQARAAIKVGMNAKGLRLLELVARKNIVDEFFESSSDDKSVEIPSKGNLFQQSLLERANIELMKTVLSNLNDCETLNIIAATSYLANPSLQVADSIQWNEASGNYERALRDYERAIQVKRIGNLCSESDMFLEKGMLDCMLKLGRFENVLSRVLTQDKTTDKVTTKAFAIEAASHLGQWETISSLVSENESSCKNASPDDIFRQATGEAILCVRNRNWGSIDDSFRTARTAVMDKLSSVARESYSRAYTDIAKLQCIRELEDAAALFRTEDAYSLKEIVESTLPEGWAWDGRLKLTTPRAAWTIMNTRATIARLGGDPVMESSLLLDIGKQAFNDGMPSVAEKFYSQAEATLSSIPICQNNRSRNLDVLMDDVRVQYAKLKKESGENLLALKILGQEMVQDALIEMNRNYEDTEYLRNVAVKYERLRATNTFEYDISIENDRGLIDRFANRLLRLTQWTVEGGMQSGNEVMERFQTAIRLSPEWEKGHFQFAKYLNDLVTRFFERDSPHGIEDDVVRFNALYRDTICHQYILLAIEHYATTLKLEMKHVYQALPRLLSLWFDFVSVQPPSSKDTALPGALKPEYLDFLAENQNKANLLMADNTKAIPAAAYYTAMPQLISRVIHNNEDTAKVVKRILERVLTKFPPQAMWHLAWLKGSKNDERSRIGAEIFKGAQRVLIKNRQMQVANLLKASDSLFKFLQDLARYNPKGKSQASVVSVKSWKGIADLSEFVPPVQAALSISPFRPIKSSSKEYFPRVIPRMRAFSSKVSIMHSKAKPKKLKAFAVPGTWKYANTSGQSNGTGRISSSTPLDCDIGEIHFLVKQEAKGDLRKDARVQDLNNVINRLMASSNNSNSTLSSKSRRLRVRTFAVTCLSEDTGILEWVPDTDSLRNLVSRSYNSQVSSFCPRRRGSRMTSFGDPTLRSGYERAQNQFVKNGDLKNAVKLYYLLCLKQCPPVLSWWFVQHFRSATDWYEARKKFTLTAAAWSAIGHVIGLGDRHSENILVETKTGRVVHVDFDCIFDKGLNLPRPEVVPFRLTPNMLDAFGPTGADGMFSSGMETSLGILRENRDTLLSVLEPFIKDPVIDWKRHRTQQTSAAIDSHGEAKRSIHVIKERLSGICNLRNPNYRKLRNIIPKEILNRVQQNNMMKEILPLSVEGQVQKLCVEASKNENLVQLYVGWMPWI